MERRALSINKVFRLRLFQSVCMSLFENHKLLFAFFICLKVFEKDKSFQEGLMRLQKLPGKKNELSKIEQSRLDNSSKISDNKSSSHPKEHSQI